MRKAAAVVMLSILAGCATIAPSPPREPTDAPAAVIDEDFNPNAIAKGKDHGYGNYWGIRQQKWNLISSVRKEGGTIVRGVIFSDNYDGDWRFWQYAATKDSKA
ncbi:hypothetical protein [Thauera humireducens]|uniref:hypothetical protein n=1 Tax=Thauera humireducens TaxID=1134435 RepID=UPI00311FC17D